MELKSDEMNYLERYILRLEKDSRHWKWMRSAGLFIAILTWGSAAYDYLKMTEIQSLVTSSFPLSGTNLDLKGVELFVEGRIANLRLEFVTLLGTTLRGIFGAFFFVYCLVNWNRHIKSGLIAKTLKKMVLNQ
jgi:hypothetical protein